MNNAETGELDGIPSQASNPATTPYDYIIVGSGAGGAPLACRLARQGQRVLVLEAGVELAKSEICNERCNSQCRHTPQEVHVLYEDCITYASDSAEPASLGYETHRQRSNKG